jgi:DNA-binding beta-propeller fold protein YncE
MKKISVFFCFIVLFVQAVLFPQTSGYKVIGKINIGGEGRWDYTAVDAPAHKLYVSHGTRVHVIDLVTNKVIGEISNLHGVHGIAFADEFGKGFISNGMNDTVTVFDLKTFKTIDNIHVTGKNPDAIVYEPFAKRIFTFNGRSSNATAIDAQSDKVAGTIELGGKPEFAVSDNSGSMFVNIEDKSKIVQFDPKLLKVIKVISISPGESASGLAFDQKNGVLFAGCDNKLMTIVDSKAGKVITTLPIGGRVDACGFDPGTNFAFSSNGDGTVTVIHEDSATEFKVIDNIQTEKGLRTMALDPESHNVYLIGTLDAPNNAKSFGVLILGMK